MGLVFHGKKLIKRSYSRKNSDNTECVNKDKSINIPKGSQENS